MKELQGKVAHVSLARPRDRKKPRWLGEVMEGETGKRGGAREGGFGLLWRGAQNRWVLRFQPPSTVYHSHRKKGTQMPKRVRKSPEGWGGGHKSGVLKATHGLESQRR